MLRNRRVVSVAYDGLCLFEFGVAAELFGLARPELGLQWYDFSVVAAEPGPIRSLGGIVIDAAADLGAVEEAGTIVLPGWRDREHRPPEDLLEALRVAHARGSRIMSICSGVYVLAATGLLDGLPATTHWRYTEHLARSYPAIDVRPNVLYVDNGSLLTSAGSAAGIDLGLHLVRRDHGAAVAAAVARRLVVPPQREGGQAQFIADTVHERDGAANLTSLLGWMSDHLHLPLTVDDLARRAHLSPRTLARRFPAEVGLTPHQWLCRERVRRAQQLLETTTLSVDEVASAAGFGTAENLRHHFRRQLRTTPSRYRSAFAVAEPAP